MQPKEPMEKSSQSSKPLEKFVNNSEKGSTNKHDEARKREERKEKYKAMKKMEKDFKSSITTGDVLNRCDRCGKFLRSVAKFCSIACTEAADRDRLAILNKEEEDVVY